MAGNVKTLLVIGNGFDLAHGLKTKYTDFLHFIKKKLSIGRYGVPQYSELPPFRKYQDELQSKLKKNELTLEDIFGYVNSIGNTWIGYFNTIQIIGKEELIADANSGRIIFKSVPQ